MLDKLYVLTEVERQELFDAIPVITILIAGADGKIDDEELNWAKKLTNIRSYKEEGAMEIFYDKVNEDFTDRLDRWVNVLSSQGAKEREELLSERIANLNPILAKLEPEYGAQLYKSFVSFAEQVAKASGGFLGIGSVSKEESTLMALPMLNEIVYDEEK